MYMLRYSDIYLEYCEIPSQFNQHALLGLYLIFMLIFHSSLVPITHLVETRG